MPTPDCSSSPRASSPVSVPSSPESGSASARRLSISARRSRASARRLRIWGSSGRPPSAASCSSASAPSRRSSVVRLAAARLPVLSPTYSRERWPTPEPSGPSGGRPSATRIAAASSSSTRTLASRSDTSAGMVYCSVNRRSSPGFGGRGRPSGPVGGRRSSVRNCSRVSDSSRTAASRSSESSMPGLGPGGPKRYGRSAQKAYISEEFI
jgi:hypothetical protein